MSGEAVSVMQTCRLIVIYVIYVFKRDTINYSLILDTTILIHDSGTLLYREYRIPNTRVYDNV